MTVASSMTEYAEGRAEGIAMVLSGMSHELNMLVRRTDTIKAIAAWLDTNGGAALVVDIADAFRALRHEAVQPANGEGVAS